MDEHKSSMSRLDNMESIIPDFYIVSRLRRMYYQIFVL